MSQANRMHSDVADFFQFYLFINSTPTCMRSICRFYRFPEQCFLLPDESPIYDWNGQIIRVESACVASKIHDDMKLWIAMPCPCRVHRRPDFEFSDSIWVRRCVCGEWMSTQNYEPNGTTKQILLVEQLYTQSTSRQCGSAEKRKLVENVQADNSQLTFSQFRNPLSKF